MKKWVVCIGCLIVCWPVADAWSQKPTVDFALQLVPIQSDVDYDRPTAEEQKTCTIEAETADGVTSWVVRTATGQILRRFDDTNGDNKVDRWCYFRDGVEVYRDIDSDFNQKADQYRWLGTAGTRWGIDTDEDGRIDYWKVISPEEVTAEVVAALRDRDPLRFRRLLLAESELTQLGLGSVRTEELRRRIAQAAADFDRLARQQNLVARNTRWVFFGGGLPSVLAQGTNGATADIYFYDHVAAVIETDGKSSQLPIGTLIRSGDAWRLVDLPAALVSGEPTSIFLPVSLAARTPDNVPAPADLRSLQKLVSDLDEIDRQLAEAAGTAAGQLHARRADIVEQIARLAEKPEERLLWYRQLVDTVSVAVQSGAYPDGVARLKAIVDRLERETADEDLLAFATFRLLMAEYTQQLQSESADYGAIHDAWLGKLKALVERFPKSIEVAEAMLQIAMAYEFSGDETQALQWYRRVVDDFPKAEVAAKAAGARRRLQSEGQPFQFRANTTDGRPLDTASLRGKVLVVYYWASWCEPCRQDLSTLQNLANKYARNGLVVIGVNLDTDSTAFQNLQRQYRFPGPVVREPGGLDGPLAEQMGILTLPTIFVVDRRGVMADRNARINELEKTLEPLLR
ncbi:MAG: thioredoxin [Pirellulaceae bacterium]|nr:MAG: thioredoxin [Pirellulaceae bacterium]